MRLAEWLRSEFGTDQRAFAEMIGVHPISVSKYSTGRTIPRAEVASKIVEVTAGKVTPTDLVAAYQERAARAVLATAP
jgi:DNA-binding transcriptional regulator YdaS (Cro superfamily)